MSAQELITDHLDLWTEATATKSNSGRGNSGKTELVGIQKLRELILELATKGKLTIQNPQTESANELMVEVQSIRRGLEDAGKIKKQKEIPPIEHEKLTFSVPKNWAWVRLAELTEKIGSGATPRGGKSAYVTNGVPFFRSQNIWNDGLNLTDVAYIPEEIHRKMANTHVYPEDILLNITGASLGRTTIVPSEIEEANVSQHVTIIRIIPPVSREFIHYLLLSPYVQAMVWGRQVGMAREGLSKKVLELFELPLPPLDEQHRIVQKIDELMALCDRLEQQTSDQIAAHDTLVDTLLGTLTQSQNATELAENWTRLAAHFDTLFTTEQSIDKLKQTILQLAVMGRLVEQDARDEPSDQLLNRIATTVMNSKSNRRRAAKQPEGRTQEVRPFKIPSNWVWAPLHETGLTSTGKTPSTKSAAFFTGDIPFIGPGHVTASGEITKPEKFLSEEGVLYSDEALPGDILTVCIGGSIGKAAKVVERCGFNQQLNKIRPVLVEPDYILTAINAEFFQNSIRNKATGSATPIINRSKWESICIPLPPLTEQKRIVQKVGELTALCDQIQKRLNQARKTRCQLAETIVQGAMNK